MNALVLTMLLLAAAGVVLVHCLCVVAALGRKKWSGHKGRFAGVSASLALLAGGAAGMVMGMQHAPLLLLIGAAGSYIFDRRGSC